ncbi:ATP-binding protein [Kitasatospora purpeofusca]|uniref:ATP-binding protein n=1 Tax=Kitasatospora purpeofusca TaxID=67352 RepID=UPI0038668441
MSTLPLPPDWSVAREELREVLVRAGWPGSTADDAELALFELFVNAWRHGGSPAPLVVVVLLEGVLRVSVADGCPKLPEQRAVDAAESYALSGRGLHLVRSLTDRFGADPRRSGKSVSFELDAAA